MAFGINIKNDGGEVQVDDKFYNFFKWRSGTASVTFETDSNAWLDQNCYGKRVVLWPFDCSDITDPSHPFGDLYNFENKCAPFLFGIRLNPSSWINVNGPSVLDENNGNEAAFRFFGEPGWTVSVPWLCCLDPVFNWWELPKPDTGMVIYDYAEGVEQFVRFSSKAEYPSIVGIYPITSPISASGVIGSDVDVTVQDAENNYFFIQEFAYALVYGSPSVVYTNLMKRISATSIRVSAKAIDTWGAGSPSDAWSTNISTLNLVEIAV